MISNQDLCNQISSQARYILSKFVSGPYSTNPSYLCDRKIAKQEEEKLISLSFRLLFNNYPELKDQIPVVEVVYINMTPSSMSHCWVWFHFNNMKYRVMINPKSDPYIDLCLNGQTTVFIR